jgi:hypothetical protein
MIGLVTVFSALLMVAERDTAPPLPRQQLQAVVERMLVTEPFLGSDEERSTRRSVARYFSRQEYMRLRGNPLLGYWDVGTFRWRGRQLAFGGVRNVHPSARPISAAAWTAAVEQVARRNGLDVTANAPVRLEGGCVGAVVDATEREPVPGVLVELRLEGPTGTLLYRVGMGKATVEDAIGAALDLVLRFARSLQGAAQETGGRLAR